eukprot:c29971_g1_i1 orf=63-521(-)
MSSLQNAYNLQNLHIPLHINDGYWNPESYQLHRSQHFDIWFISICSQTSVSCLIIVLLALPSIYCKALSCVVFSEEVRLRNGPDASASPSEILLFNFTLLAVELVMFSQVFPSLSILNPLSSDRVLCELTFSVTALSLLSSSCNSSWLICCK